MGIKSLSLFTCLLLSGCMMGPDFKAPKVLAPSTWFRPTTVPDKPNPFQASEPPDAKWWAALDDPLLNTLVERIAKENLDILVATARLEESRAERGITAAGLFPQLNGDGSYTREKLSDKGVITLISGGGGAGASGAAGGPSSSQSGGFPSASASPPFNVYQYGFDASWEIDLWGRVRRSVEAANANTQAAEDARRGTDLSVIAELVSDYVQLRGVQANLQVTRDNLQVAQDLADLTKERAKGGISNELDVANANAEAATVGAQLPQLQQQEEMMMNAIALLLGRPPGALASELASAGPIPPVPPQVPVGVPSELAQRRPDVRQAEAQLHAATAEIGEAKAEFFPQVTLVGNGALQAIKFSDLNSWAARSYSYGPSVTLPIFEGGRLVSQLKMRNDEQREAALNYRKVLLNAFHEVDNALTSFRAEQQRYRALAVSVEENGKALALATERYKMGLSTFLDVLTAERAKLQAEQQAIESRQTESVNMVQLYKALGGGWEKAFPVH